MQRYRGWLLRGRGAGLGFVSMVDVRLEVTLAQVGPTTHSALGTLEDTTEHTTVTRSNCLLASINRQKKET